LSQFESIATQTAHTNPNVKPLAQAWGDRVSATNLSEAAGSNIQRAGLWSTAPYIDPVEQLERKRAEEAVIAAEEEAKAERIKIREANVAPENRRPCGQAGCRAPARNASDYCRWHQPLPEAE
jgi:hypothetical protein